MCGIVAATAHRDVSEILISGLHTLEYRGYDSAGIAMQTADGLARQRTLGKVRDLEDLLAQSPVEGHSGIAHTRWATHGEPSTVNAHPHVSGPDIALVHNGIIENHDELRTELAAAGYEFESETDTEVMAHLVHRIMAGGVDLFDAVGLAVRRLRGAYAIAVLSAAEPGVVVGARAGSPLVLGIGFHEHFLASDVHPLLAVTNRFVYLEEGDLVRLDTDGYEIRDRTGTTAEREVSEADLAADAVQRGQAAERHGATEAAREGDAFAAVDRYGSRSLVVRAVAEGARASAGAVLVEAHQKHAAPFGA